MPPAREEQPGKWISFALTALMHVLLAVFLFFGVQWTQRSPEPVSVELVRTLPSVQPAAPPAPPQPPTPPAQEQPTPAPVPKPVAKEPEETKQAKPDIAIKEPKEKPKKVEPKPEPKPVEKPKPEKKPEPKPDPKPEKKPEPKVVEKAPAKPAAIPAPDESDRLRALANQDVARAQAVTRTNDLLKRSQEEVVGNSKAVDEWSARIVAKVKPKIVKPPNLTGRPKAIFTVTLLPDGSVNEVHLKSSSGNPTLDANIERAIRASSPLPLPARREVFEPELNLTFDPNDPAGG
jgi:colicin import membrane protein